MIDDDDEFGDFFAPQGWRQSFALLLIAGIFEAIAGLFALWQAVRDFATIEDTRHG